MATREARVVAAFVLAVAVLAGGANPAAAQATRQQVIDTFEKGRVLLVQGKPREALPYLERAAEWAPATFGPNHQSSALAYNVLGLAYLDLEQSDRAETLLLRAVRAYEEGTGPDDPVTSNALIDLSNVYYQTRDLARAEALLRRAQTIRERRFGKDSGEVALVLNNLGNLYNRQGEYARAEQAYRQAITIREARQGMDALDLAMPLNNLAVVYLATARYPQAEATLRRSLAIAEAHQGRSHPEVARTLNNLAMVLRHRGEYDRAEPLLLRSLAIREERFGKDSTMASYSLNDLGLMYYEMGLYDKAQRTFDRALEIQEAKLGKDSLSVAGTVNNLGNVAFSREEYDQAEKLYRRALDIKAAVLGKADPSYARSLSNLANVFNDQKEYAKAEPLYHEALRVREAALGKDHPDVAETLLNLGNLYDSMEQRERADPIYRRSLAIYETRSGKDHPAALRVLHNLADMKGEQGAWGEATRLFDRKRRGVRRHVASVLPSLSPADQLTFLLGEYTKHLHMALSYAWERRRDGGMPDLSAAWLLNGKAVAHEALAQRALVERDFTDPARAELASELLSVRHQLATLSLATAPAGGADARRAQLEALTTQQLRLEADLARAGPTGGRPDPWVTLGEVRNALPADALLVEVARFRLDWWADKPEEGKATDHYLAWLVPAAGKGDVKIVDLGDADKIDASVREVRTRLAAAQEADPAKNVIARKGEADAEKELRGPLDALARLVLHPVLKEAGPVKRLVLSPDGPLWLAPWAALPLPDGKYAVEAYTVQYVVSGRDLVAPAVKAKTEPPMILADPDYELTPDAARQAAAELLGRQPTAVTRAVAGGSKLPRVARLPGTAAEAQAIKPELERYAGQKPWVYRGKNALEAVAKDFRSPKAVVLATHGFFREEPDAAAKGTAENPLLRCGLLLAGCNDRSARGASDDDGVLTGLEIVGCDLRGTELVVLSACETGLGDVRNGEGVAGLRQAFQLAGARSVVASLWQVPDRDTALLMTGFFDQLAQGKDKAEALRAAQRARIQARRDRGGAAHPYFWAAFTVTGR